MPQVLFRQIALDSNGLPVNHDIGLQAAAVELMQFVNELPESVYFLAGSDADLAAERMVMAYLRRLWSR